MAFLFKSKKNTDKVPGAKEGSAITASTTSLPNGKGPGQTTPASSVNNSLSSLQRNDAASPSPEQLNGRRGPSVEDPSVRTGGVPMASNPNASLYPWSQRRLTYTTTHPNPFPRYGAAVNSVASKEGDIYLMGGLINSSTVKGDLWMVESGGNMNCYPLATTAEGPGPRVGHASLLVGNAFIVYGGDTKMEDSDVLDETLYLLNTSTRQWSKAIPAGPRPSGRYGHSLNILGSKIYVFGGQVEGYFMNDLVAFDLNQLQEPTNKWEMLVRNTEEGGPPQGDVPPARTNHSMVTFNEKLYLFGGTNGFQWFNDVWCYDPLTNTWTSLDCIGYIPAPREGHAAAIVDDVMYIFGGRTEEGADLGDLAAFRITSKRWYTFQNMGPSPSPRSGHSMTAYGKQIVVLAGEPSTATREASDLAIAYLLDTSKIRYPNDSQIQPAPGERVPGARRQTIDKTSMGINGARGPVVRDGSNIPEQKRMGPPRESIMGASPYGRGAGQPNVNGNDSNGIAPGSAQPQGPQAGSKLPRASMAQAPSGPPPQQALPAPRQNGPSNTPPMNNGPAGRGKPFSQAKPDRSFGSAPESAIVNRAVENAAAMSQPQNRNMSPVPSNVQSKDSPVVNGRRTPTQAPAQSVKLDSPTDIPPSASNGVNIQAGPKARQTRQQGSQDSTQGTEPALKSITNRQQSPPPPTRQTSNPLSRRGSTRNSQTVALLKELDAVKSRNAWYTSELELARKQGYTPNPSSSPMLDQRAAESFDDDDKPLIEALLAMKAELTNVQASVDKQAITASKKIAEVEKQRDAAVREAVYAKAKLAAHSGSQSSTPQPDSDARDLGVVSAERSNEISRHLATALATQQELKTQVDQLTSELKFEKENRKLAEETLATSQAHMETLEKFKQEHLNESGTLRKELQELQNKALKDAVICAEAVAAAKLLKVDKDALEKQYKDAQGSSREHGDTFKSLHEVMKISEEMRDRVEDELKKERALKETIEARFMELKAEHESQAAELEQVTQRLGSAEKSLDYHAGEARKHRQAVLSGLDKAATREIGTSNVVDNSDRIVALTAQVTSLNAVVGEYQSAHKTASEEAEKELSLAKERVAGLEAYQGQISRESASIRKQLQTAMREIQTHQAANSDLKYQLANQQLEANAVNVQHSTLKDILSERGISPSTASRARGSVRELEQQLAASNSAHEETKTSFQRRQQESENAYREKLGQLETDYQSAVHYVKGTEKMLKRLKDELAKYKSENTRMKEQIEAEEKSGSENASSAWESERAGLNSRIETLQAEMQSSTSQLEHQLADVRSQLQTAKQNHDQLAASSQQARSDLTQLQQENSQLERRAQDAEQKVSLLLDQVEHSVDNYRRQSARVEARPVSHNRSTSDTVSETSLYTDNQNRNSLALDSLANELETLRTHWETTNKNYRLSNTFDFEDSKDKPDMTGGLSEWRKRLDVEDEERSRQGSASSLTVGGLKPGLREMSPSGKEVGGPAGGKVNVI